MNIISAYIEITNACNLNCETCYNRSGSNRERQEISVGQLAGMIRRLRSLGCKTVYLAGGEPCLHSDFDRILDLPGSYPDLKFGIVTNGTVHPSKLICQYRTQSNLTVQVSLDGSCEAQNLKTRGKQNFEKTVRLIKLLCENQERRRRFA
jgi:MoaA/NifB/PqqE/SkfB family radical SAM enzyme